MHTISFRSPGTHLPSAPGSHEPNCLASYVNITGLYATRECCCQLDANRPLLYYTRPLSTEQLETWNEHFDIIVSQHESDPCDPEEILWQDLEVEHTETSVRELAEAVQSGLFDWIEAWYREDEDDETSLTLFVGIITLNEDDEMGYPIVAVTSELTSKILLEDELSRPVIDDEDDYDDEEEQEDEEEAGESDFRDDLHRLVISEMAVANTFGPPLPEKARFEHWPFVIACILLVAAVAVLTLAGIIGL